MTDSHCYISDLPDDIQEQLFDEGHFCQADDWIGRGHELLNNMYSDPKNTHTDFPCIWLEFEHYRRNAFGKGVACWAWDEMFRVKDAVIYFQIDKTNLDDAHRIFVEKLGLDGRQFLLLQIIQDEFVIKMDRQGDAEVSGFDERVHVDDRFGLQMDDDFVDECIDVEIDKAMVGPLNPMFGETTVGDLYPALNWSEVGITYTQEGLAKVKEDFARDVRILTENLHSYVSDYLDHVQKALAAEHEHISSFEYWKDMAEANEWTVTLTS